VIALMAKKQKYYTVWKGRQTGVFTTWKEAEEQVKGFETAQYKSFESLKEAEDAFKGNYWQSVQKPQGVTALENILLKVFLWMQPVREILGNWNIKV
jgi:ribonuclease HI